MTPLRHLPLPARAAHPLDRWDTIRPAILTGDRRVYGLAHSHQVSLYQAGYRVHNIDCAIRFNVFAIAEEARTRGLSEESVLSSIIVQRAFTPYQILDSVEAALQSEGSTSAVYALLAPAKQFFDGDVRRDEAAFLLDRLADRLEQFEARGIPLLLVEFESYPSPLFEPFLKRLLGLSGFRILSDSTQALLPQTSYSRYTYHGKNRTAPFTPDHHDRRAVS